MLYRLRRKIRNKQKRLELEHNKIMCRYIVKRWTWEKDEAYNPAEENKDILEALVGALCGGDYFTGAQLIRIWKNEARKEKASWEALEEEWERLT